MKSNQLQNFRYIVKLYNFRTNFVFLRDYMKSYHSFCVRPSVWVGRHAITRPRKLFLGEGSVITCL